MTRIAVPIVKRKPPVGELSEDKARYVMPSEEKGYAPWVVEAVAPTWRDLWAVLRNRYVPKLGVSRPNSTAELSDILKDVWTNAVAKESHSDA